MRRFAPTQEQTEAIQTQRSRFTVRASAGSGKTTVLVQRYLRLVTDEGFAPDEILAITFTRKAAAEMKQRIVREFRRLGRPDDAQTAETGPIQTIHSLCERILRENSLAAGCDPGFEVMPESSQLTLLERAIRWCLATEMSDYPAAQGLVAKMAGKQAFDAPTTVHAELSVHMRAVLSKLRGSGMTTSDLRPLYESPAEVANLWRRALCDNLPVEARPALMGASPADAAGLVIQALKDSGHNKPAWLTKTGVLYTDESACDTCGLVQLCLLAWDWMENQMMDRQEFDFPFLEERAVRLVQNDPTTVKRLRDQYKAVLVDEAQDVNPVQYRLIDALQIGSEMMVGDPQQSIFGFRMADRELFVARSRELENLRLSANHRSVPGILRFVDDLFDSVWSDDYQAMSAIAKDDDDPFVTKEKADYTGVEAWPLEGKDADAVADGVAAIVKEGTRPGDIALLIRNNRSSADFAQKLQARGIATKIIGGSEKFYTRIEVRDIANALECLTNPLAEFQLLALLESPFVGVSLDTLVLLTAQRPVLTAIKDFQTPIEEDREKLKEFLAWFAPLSAVCDRIPAWEVLSELFRSTDYLQNVATQPNAEQTLANVRKLFSLATKEPLLRPMQFAEKIRQIQELRHREGDALSIDEDADAVTIMTIHRSKGLEFDVVVLPETQTKFAFPVRGIAIDQRRGVVATHFDKTDSVVWKWLKHETERREREEALRVLYVGMTRARKRLCVVVATTPTEATPAGLITSRMGLKDADLPGLFVRKQTESPR